MKFLVLEFDIDEVRNTEGTFAKPFPPNQLHQLHLLQNEW